MGVDNSQNYYQLRSTADGGPHDVVGSPVGGLDFVGLAVVELVQVQVQVQVQVGWLHPG